MFSFLSKLFDTDGFMPRWHCGDWSEGHGWLHILSDLAVWGAYFAIPCILVFFAAKKRDLPFRRVFWLFGAFILACGTTHLMDSIIFWWPAYRLSGVVKLTTALVSWGTVAALIPIIPKALAMRSPESLEREVRQRTEELHHANEAMRREVNERKHVENSLREQRKWLRVTLASIGDAVIATDSRGRIMFMNTAAELLTGWQAEQAETRPLESVFRVANEGDSPVARDQFEAALGGRSGIGVIERSTLISRTNRRIAIEENFSPIRDENGVARGVVLVFHDVTERRRAEQRTQYLARAGEALAAPVTSENSLQLVARLAVPAVADWCRIELLDEEDQPEQDVRVHADPAREAALQQWPRKTEEPDLVESPDSATIVTADERIIRQAIPLELSAEAEAARLMPRCLIRAPLTARGRRVGNITWALTDGERTYTADDAALAEELARRTAVAVENGRLYRELQDADRRKNEFLAMLAHELRNPLAPVRNALMLLDRGDTDEATRHDLQSVMVKQMEHIVRLVDDLLDVSRIMRGKIELRMEPMQLSEAVERAVQTVRPSLDEKGQHLQVEMPEKPIWLKGDLVRLSQVVSNLLHNAGKYSPPGGKIWLTVESEDHGAAVRIRDEGMGIEADMLPKIFDLFTQSDRSVERAAGGLGIGLTVVRSIVEMHGGTVEARSDGLEKGSEFIVRLATDDASQKAPRQSWSPAATKPLRVLVVEDNVGSARTLSMMLRKFWHHDVALAHDGLAAVETAESYRPDLILLDIGLPGMNGYEVARRLRAIPQLAGVTIVALTGYGQAEDRRRTREAGFDDHLVKPVGVELLEALFEGMDGKTTVAGAD